MVCDISEDLRRALEEHSQECYSSIQENLTVTRASENGDSFAADVFRIAIRVPIKDSNGNHTGDSGKPNTQEIRVIAKLAPKLKFRREMYNIVSLFEREKFMYTTLLPQFRAFQERHLRDGEPHFDHYPSLIQSCSTENDEFILLNDICDEGFGNIDRTQGVSFAVCEEVMQKFARLHAISFVYQERDREGFHALIGENLRESLFVKDLPQSFVTFLQSKVDLIAEKLKDRQEKEETDKEVLERMKIFREQCTVEMFAACHVTDYAVVCHGDSWISNFMFKVDENRDPLDLKFIDFQMSRFTTPVIDLSYFLGCSSDKKLRERLPEILLCYYRSLMEEIRRYGHETPENLYPYEVFTRHCKKFMKFGFGMAMMSLHSITCQPADMPDVNFLLETANFAKLDDITKNMSGNPAYCERVTDLVRDMVKLGYL